MGWDLWIEEAPNHRQAPNGEAPNPWRALAAEIQLEPPATEVVDPTQQWYPDLADIR